MRLRRTTRGRVTNGDAGSNVSRWLVTTFVISVAVTVIGGGMFLWAVYRESRSAGAISIGATLFVFGFSAVVVCFGMWVASSGYRKPESGP